MLKGLRERFASPHASRESRTDLTILEHTLAVDVYWQRARRPLETQPDIYAAPLDAIFTMTARTYAPAAGPRSRRPRRASPKIPRGRARPRRRTSSTRRASGRRSACERAAGATSFLDDAPTAARLGARGGARWDGSRRRRAGDRDCRLRRRTRTLPREGRAAARRRADFAAGRDALRAPHAREGVLPRREDARRRLRRRSDSDSSTETDDKMTTLALKMDRRSTKGLARGDRAHQGEASARPPISAPSVPPTRSSRAALSLGSLKAARRRSRFPLRRRTSVTATSTRPRSSARRSPPNATTSARPSTRKTHQAVLLHVPRSIRRRLPPDKPGGDAP